MFIEVLLALLTYDLICSLVDRLVSFIRSNLCTTGPDCRCDKCVEKPRTGIDK